MVDLETLEKEDIESVKNLLIKHQQYTQSSVANRIIDNWEDYQNKFVKVMPTDYKRVLEAVKKAKETGMSEDEAVMEAAHG